MDNNSVRFIPASDASLLVEFGQAISRELHLAVLSLFHAIATRHDLRIRNLHPGYASLLIDFDPLQLTHSQLESRVKLLLKESSAKPRPVPRTISIPVCYDPDFAPDLHSVAEHSGLSMDEVINLHSSATYLVYFLGFSPGFAYLGELPPQLHTPRLPTPRTHVHAGSVGIARDQTGVYPFDSPGGWRLIGRTPLRMFHPTADPPTRLQPGDFVRFAPISTDEFHEIALQEQDVHPR